MTKRRASSMQLDLIASQNAQRKATLEDIIIAYRETGSVWKAAKRLGMAGQSVHERLRAANYPMPGRHWTDDEHAELIALLTAGLAVGQIAHRLGRTFGSIASRMSVHGLYVQRTPKEPTLPRGAGYDKTSIGRHLAALERSDVPPTRYCRANALNIEPFVWACQRHFPDRWTVYVATRSDLPTRVCPYCLREFIPGSGKQVHCTRKCAADARTDAAYFGGNRRATIGLTEGVCQLCGRGNIKGLSSHHVFGKENDPDNLSLIALCQGCHKTVTLLASRTFVDNTETWETLISLVWLRKHGPEIAAGTLDGNYLYTFVDIEMCDDEDDEADNEEVAPHGRAQQYD